jgi:cytidylate kinase
VKKDIRIAVSGKSGCGNTTIGKLVADRLGLSFINFTFRNLAQERGISFAEALRLAAIDDSWDREIDRRQVQLARESNGCVLSSRLAIWMLEDADLKVFLTASAGTRAARIVKREGGDFETVAAFTDQRDGQDHSRYTSLYNIDNDNYQFADMIIDTENLDPQAIAQLIIDAAEKIK